MTNPNSLAHDIVRDLSFAGELADDASLVDAQVIVQARLNLFHHPERHIVHYRDVATGWAMCRQWGEINLANDYGRVTCLRCLGTHVMREARA